MEDNFENVKSDSSKILSKQEIERLELQNSRIVNEHKAHLLELQAQKHWDLFYKRNETRFFRDRHWTTREFQELLEENTDRKDEAKVLFEIGCGVGNFIYPLISEELNYQIYACDLSPRAIDFVKSNPLYDPRRIKAFHCDITSEGVFENVDQESVQIATLIFVLSAIHPNKHSVTLRNVYKLLKPGGLVLFRDYGLYDMAQLRFKPGHKIDDNFYMRQDGTRTYFFSLENIRRLFEDAGFTIVKNEYVHRRTVNKKENVDVPRIFVQVKAMKSEA